MRDRTLILFHSDNGGLRDPKIAGQVPAEPVADNGPLRGGKGSLYEGGSRVVALANWPGRIEAGTTVDGLIHAVDLYPTFVTLAGGRLDRGKPLDGMDVWATISRGEPSPRTEVVYNIEPSAAALRQGDWKLVWHVSLPAAAELFNLAEDPYETTDLAAKHPDKVAALQGRVDRAGGRDGPAAVHARGDRGRPEAATRLSQGWAMIAGGPDNLVEAVRQFAPVDTRPVLENRGFRRFGSRATCTYALVPVTCVGPDASISLTPDIPGHMTDGELSDGLNLVVRAAQPQRSWVGSGLPGGRVPRSSILSLRDLDNKLSRPPASSNCPGHPRHTSPLSGHLFAPRPGQQSRVVQATRTCLRRGRPDLASSAQPVQLAEGDVYSGLSNPGRGPAGGTGGLPTSAASPRPALVGKPPVPPAAWRRSPAGEGFLGRPYRLEEEASLWELGRVLGHLAGYTLVRRVDVGGSISLTNRSRYVGKALRGREVDVSLDPIDVQWVYSDGSGWCYRREPAEELTADRIRRLEVSRHRERPDKSSRRRGCRDSRLNPLSGDIRETPERRPRAGVSRTRPQPPSPGNRSSNPDERLINSPRAPCTPDCRAPAGGRCCRRTARRGARRGRASTRRGCTAACPCRTRGAGPGASVPPARPARTVGRSCGSWRLPSRRAEPKRIIELSSSVPSPSRICFIRSSR